MSDLSGKHSGSVTTPLRSSCSNLLRVCPSKEAKDVYDFYTTLNLMRDMKHNVSRLGTESPDPGACPFNAARKVVPRTTLERYPINQLLVQVTRPADPRSPLSCRRLLVAKLQQCIRTSDVWTCGATAQDTEYVTYSRAAYTHIPLPLPGYAIQIFPVWWT